MMKNYYISVLLTICVSFFANSQSITVLTPNGGEVLHSCQQYTIDWTASGVSNYYNIDYSLDGGTIWASIASNYLSASSDFLWTVPQVQSSTCLIRITDAQNTSIVDQSNANFTINIPVTVLSPNGGETFQGGTVETITWNGVGTSGSYNLYYSTNGGTSWTTIVTNYGTGSGTYNWTVPSLSSSNCLIRVRDAATACMIDESNAPFTIIPATPIINVITPNGGEVLYSCQQYTIDWTVSGSVSNYYNIDYSLDGGTIWASIATNYLSAASNFSWTVPQVQSNTCLIRVMDAQNNTIVDQSAANFTINIPITVLQPNGGETFQGGDVETITWNAASTSGSYNLYYSTNGGTTWTTIVTNYATGSGTYNWTVPNIPSSNCLIRVRDAITSCMVDQSNAPFTIIPDIPVLTSPNGAENLYAGCTYNIIWNPSTFYSTVNLEYSTDNGVTWNTIVTSTTNDGIHAWDIPETIASNTCLIRASNSANTTLNDISNATFNILEPIKVTYANGGETLYGCSSYNLTWTKPGSCITRFTVSYSIDNGATWTTIATPYNSGSGTTQSQSWTVPNSISTTEALISVADYYDALVFDISDLNFNIEMSNDITITSPNGGEVLNASTSHLITWTNLPSASGLYNVQYSTNSGSSWTTLASGITGNAYTWNIANIPATTYKIRVTDAVNSCKYDISDADFTVVATTPVLLSPNGGEVFKPGCSTSITWNTSTFYTNVRLDYSSDGGTTWTNIVTSASNSGSYSWTIPNEVSTSCLVKIANTSDLLNADTSDASFTIEEPIQVTSPNGGETLFGCGSETITWSKPGSCISRFNVFYSLDNGATWTLLAAPYNSGSGNTQSQSWTLSNSFLTTTALVKVEDYYNSAVDDQSDAVFSISPSNDITVTAPNGGESFNAYSSTLISWTNTANTTGQYNIQYSTNGGSSWSTIATNVIGNNYSWSVPNLPGTTCKVRVLDAGNTCKYDISDANFTILPPTPVLLTPNGGEQLPAGCSYAITWDASTFYSNVRLEYSSDNGVTWNTIVSSTSNNGLYTWTAPYVESNQYLIVARNTANLALADTSNANFSVVQPINVLSANGGETLYGCSSHTISWSKPSSCISRFNIYYSIDNGTSWTLISAPNNSGTGNTQSYNWTVPNGISASNSLFKVTDYYNDATVYDVSDAVFTIAPSNDVTVTSPNGGESYNALTTTLITWTNLPSASGLYNLQYSTNGGSSWTTIINGITGNAYTWTVPNAPSSNCKIKVIDAGNTCKYDISDAVFTIEPQIPVLLTPNGGESLPAGCSYDITWDPTTFYSSVRLDYSIDGGLTWLVIASSTSNDGIQSWTVPTTISNNCLIVARNTSNLLIADTSDAVFSITAPLAMTSPNGGETLYGCSSYPITWSKPGSCISRFNLYYSLDNGSTWTIISTPYNSGTGNTQTYNWGVPNGISSGVLFKVEDYYNTGTVYDISDAPATIAPSNDITVTSPNGGEMINGLTNTLISWTNLPSATGLYNIQYSTNGGSSWSTIANGVSGNNYNWSVPNSPSTSCRIRILDAGNTCKFDISDANFTIVAATPVLLAPNGGETFFAGCTTTITWNTTTLYTNVRLDYSLDGGVTWFNITTSTTNDGSHDWTLPGTLSTSCLIRISNSSDLTNTDQSDAFFTLEAPITVTAPNGGETFSGCSDITINWNKPGACISRFNIHYSTDNGSTWVLHSTPYNSGSGNTQSAVWSINNSINSSTVLVQVSDYYNASVNDQSDAPFAIVPTNDITVTSPNGGEVYQGLTNQMITWTNTANVSGNYTVQYSTNGGSSWVTIASNIIGNSVNWNIPNTPSANYKIRVMDYSNTCKQDVSDAVFEVTPATPILLTPNGGESMYAATSYTITWDPTTYFSNVRIDYSTDNGLTWNAIVTSTSNDGNHPWTVPNTPSTQCLVKVSNTSNLSINDESNSVFEIKAAVTVLTPNGDDGITTWGGCTVTSITFDHSPAYTSWNVKYSLDNGATWVTLTTNWTQSSNPATYNWNIPNTESSQVLVKVEPYLNTSYADQSDATFTILKPVTIIQPNFGGIMQVGSTYNISWSSEGISNLYDIFYSTNGGTTWNTIVVGYNTSTNTYAWTVPNTPSTNCLIRVRDNINSCKEDISDIPFTISTSAPALTLTSPNGGEVLTGCSNQLITWTETSLLGTYDLFYSTNAGVSWNTIELNYATNNQTYLWTVPNSASGQVLVRVKASSTAIEDQSDALLTILEGTMDITTNDTTICTGASVALNVTGPGNYSWTPTTGLDDPSSATPIATPTTTTTYTVQSANGTCVLSDQVTITTSTSGAVPVDVAIVSDLGTSICAGTTVTYTATPDNEGTTPAYQWQVNGSPAGTNAPTFSSTTLADGDVVSVVLTSNMACVTNNPAVSNGITMSVAPTQAPTVSVSASTTTICSGTQVDFTATSANAGANPSYQWQVNGLDVGTDAATFSSTTLAQGDQVTVIVTSDNSCTLGQTAPSNTVTLTVSDVPSQPLAITGSTTVCEGSGSTYFISPVAGASSYTWTLPASWTGSSTTSTINALHGQNSGFITVTADNACGASIPQSVFVTANALPNVVANASATSICSGAPLTLYGTGASTYVWDNGVTNGTSFNPTVTATYTLTGTSVNGCSATDLVTVVVNTLPTVVANASDTDVCAGETVTLTGSGATSYTWNNGVSNGIVFTPTATTTYTVTGSNGGCSNTAQVTVNVGSAPLVSAGLDQVVCAGTSITLNGAGANAYSWNNGITNGVAFTPAVSGTYIVTGFDAVGCSATDTVSVVVNAVPLVSASATDTELCVGEAVTLTGTGAVSYTWNNGVSDGVSFIPASSGTYTVVGTGANGCTATANVTVNVHTPPTVVANASNSSVCAGNMVTLTGNGAMSYSWDNGVSNGVAFAPSTSTAYTVTGTDLNGCTDTDVINISVNVLPVVSAGTDQAICPGSTVILSGSGADTYTWNNGVTNNVAFNPVTANEYIVTGTDLNGCSQTDTVSVSMLSAPTIVANASELEVCAGEGVTLNGFGGVSHTWDNGVSDGVTFFPTSTTTYTVTGTGSNGCTGTASVTILVHDLPVVTANATSLSVCLGNTVTLSGSGAMAYTWDNGIADGAPFTPTIGATYMVVGTDNNGCNGSDQITISVNSLPVVSAGADQVVCPGTAVTLSASGTNSYSWNNGVTNGIAFTPASSNDYIVTGTDLNGCSQTDTVTVTVHATPAIQANASDTELCIGESLTLSGSGGTSYAWNNGVNDGVSFIPSGTNTYTVSSTDINGCQGSASVTVTVHTLPSVQALASETEVCAGETITLNGSGAQNYSWSNGALNGVAFAPASNGSYTVTGTDVNGCVNTASVNITVHSNPIVTASADQDICEGSSVQISASGAASYQWTGGLNGGTVAVSPTVTTLYTVTGTDIFGCSATDNVLVNVTSAPIITVSPDATICEGESATLTASGASNLTWNNGAGTGGSVTVSPSTTTVYSVSGDGAGCSGSTDVTVTVNALPVIIASGTSPICNGDEVTLSATGGTSYTWDNGLGNGASVQDTPGATTTYNVTGTDANGCSNTDAITIVVNPLPNPIVSVSPGTLSTGTFATYQWYVNNTPIPGATGQTYDYNENGTFYVEVTDGNGCTAVSPGMNLNDAHVKDIASELNIRFYPNPSSSFVTVDFGQLDGWKIVRVTDVSGKLVLETETVTETLLLELSVEPGTYFLTVESKDQIIHMNDQLIIK